jgi:hypothetical protein
VDFTSTPEPHDQEGGEHALHSNISLTNLPASARDETVKIGLPIFVRRKSEHFNGLKSVRYRVQTLFKLVKSSRVSDCNQDGEAHVPPVI